MPSERLSMRKVKEVLRLHFGLKLGKRQIARSCSISHSTVMDYINRAKKAGLGWPLPSEVDDTALEASLFPSDICHNKTTSRPLPDYQAMHSELRKKGVTLQLLWYEYKQQYPEGYQHTQFSELYSRWAKTLDVSLRQEHVAGEKMFVDFAGKTVPIIDAHTGEISEAEIFVAVLGASNYTYATAVSSQDLPSWIECHIRAFEYYGGVAEIIVPDNLKSGVIKACRYEPDLNPTYRDLCQHYGTVVIPARAGKPKDKAKVEAAVLLVTRWIIAALRHHTFFKLMELNAAIQELLERLNARKFHKLDCSRKDLFEKLDRSALKPLMVDRYEYAEWKKAAVNIDYHIEIEGHYYSVPYQLIRQHVEVRFTISIVEILYKGKRVALHQMSHQKGKFTTCDEHRPQAHQKYLEWTPSRIITWSAQAGPQTAELVERIFASRPHPEQGFRSCLGIISLGKKYGNDRLEAACGRALSIKSYSYKSVKSILESGFDRLPLPKQEVMPIVEHDNIRGGSYYN